MQFVTIKSFVSPLEGFLILPPATQEKKSDTFSCKLDDEPQLYVIGSIGQVNQKISHLELGLKRYDSTETVIGEVGLKKHKPSRKLSRVVRAQERDQKVMQKSGRRTTDTNVLTTRGKITQKKSVTEKDKLVELYQYPGYCKEQPTPLPNGIDLSEILGKVIRAQGKTPIGKTRWASKMLRKFLDAPCIQAILLDSFWWQFLHLYHPNQEIQGHLFERIAENYSRVLMGCHKVANQEHILTHFPSLLSQAVYTCFCYCFSRSWFNTHEFKAEICDVFSEWLRGSLSAPGSYNKWDYSQLEPERSRREDLLSGKGKLGTGCDISFSNYSFASTTWKHSSKHRKKHASSRKPIKKIKKSVSKKKIQKKVHLEENTSQYSHSLSSAYRSKEDDEQYSLYKHQRSPKKKLKIALLPRESHPACSGPEYTWHHLNIRGHCPLIQHFLQKRNVVSKAGCDIFLNRREICKPIPYPYELFKTYAEVIKQSFKSLHKRHKGFMKAYRKHRREMRKFDQLWNCNLLIFRLEMLEEMKRQAQKQKEWFPYPEGLSSSEKLCRTPKVIFSKQTY